MADIMERLRAWSVEVDERICSMLLAEREACALIAETMGGHFIECDAEGDGYRQAREHIAAAIRARTPSTEEVE